MCLSLLHFHTCCVSEPNCNCCLSNKYAYMQLRSPEVTRVNFHLSYLGARDRDSNNLNGSPRWANHQEANASSGVKGHSWEEARGQDSHAHTHTHTHTHTQHRGQASRPDTHSHTHTHTQTHTQARGQDSHAHTHTHTHIHAHTHAHRHTHTHTHTH